MDLSRLSERTPRMRLKCCPPIRVSRLWTEDFRPSASAQVELGDKYKKPVQETSTRKKGVFDAYEFYARMYVGYEHDNNETRL
jgi:hypothetical protein